MYAMAMQWQMCYSTQGVLQRRADGHPRPAASPDLTFINSESVAASQSPDLQPAPPRQQQPAQHERRESVSAPPAWADVDL